MQPLTVIFLGPQGCGKGTQLKLLADHMQQTDPGRTIVKPVMGTLLRDRAQRPSYAGKLLKSVLERGALVEYAVSVPLFGSYLLEQLAGDEHVLIDGFPRSIEQVEFLDSAARFYGWHSPMVVRIEIPDEESLKRLALRQRSDDTPDVIRARLAWTRKAEKEIEEWFRAHSAFAFMEVDGMGTIEEVQQRVRAALKL